MKHSIIEDNICEEKETEEKVTKSAEEYEKLSKILEAEREVRDAVCKEKDEFSVEILKLNKELNELKNKPVLSEEDAEVLKAENSKLKAEDLVQMNL